MNGQLHDPLAAVPEKEPEQWLDMKLDVPGIRPGEVAKIAAANAGKKESWSSSSPLLHPLGYPWRTSVYPFTYRKAYNYSEYTKESSGRSYAVERLLCQL